MTASRSFDRQRRDHVRHQAAWATRRHEIVAAITTVESNQSWAPEQLDRPLAITPQPGERIHFVLDGAALVEHRHAGATWGSGYSGFSVEMTKSLDWHDGTSGDVYAPGPDEPAVIDRGIVTITDRRVVFDGSERTREWSYGAHLDYQHESRAPITLLQVASGQPLSGILYDVAHGPRLQLRLATAIAYATGTVSTLLGGLRQELVDHDARWPEPATSAALTAAAVPC